jgi:hypothetical protein
VLGGWAAWRTRTGRWADFQATFGLALVVAATITGTLLMLGISTRNDLLGAAVATVGVLRPLVAFIALTVHSVMNFGARYANQDGRRAPRTSRILLYFGLVMLTLSGLLYWTNVQVDQGRIVNTLFQDRLEMSFVAGTWLLSPPYLVWIALRRSRRLTGDRTEDGNCAEADDRAVSAAQPARRLPVGLSFADVAAFVGLAGLMFLMTGAMVWLQ